MGLSTKAYRLAAITSHPIQYQGPLFRAIANDEYFDFHVYFSWDFGVAKKSYDKEFGTHIAWDLPLLDGYSHSFLKNYSPRPSSEFWGQINPGIIPALFRGRYDAIILFGWNSVTNLLAFAAAKLMGTKVFIRGENPLHQEFSKSFLKRTIKQLLLRPFFWCADAFLYIGKENRAFYEYYGVARHKLFFAPYAVDNDRFIKSAIELKSQRASLRASLGIPADAFVILFAGKLIEKKRPLDLLRAYHHLKHSNKALVAVGDGALRGEMERYIVSLGLEHIHFAGFKNQTEMPQYYALADVLVLPSGEGETWGLVVNEAMCFGLPIVVSDMVGCAKDLVRAGENGLVFLVGNVDALARALGALADNPDKKIEFSKKSLEIIKHYSFEYDVAGILKALEQTI